MQFPPQVWGPFFWHTIHIVALGYPKEPSYADKRAGKEFFESLQFLIPCGICREHYREHLTQNPVSTFLDSKQDIFKWTVMIHNKVNIMLGKPEWTEYEIIEYYKRLGKRNRSPVWKKEDMQEIDSRSFIRGFLSGSAGIFAVIAGIWGLNKCGII